MQPPPPARARAAAMASCSNWNLVLQTHRRARISPKMQPTLHMSAAGPYCVACSSSSGERYHRVWT